MKKVITLLVFLSLFSCSKDDGPGADNNNNGGGGGGTEAPKEKKYVDNITLETQNGTFNVLLKYNAAKQIISYKRETTNLSYEYDDNGRLTNIKDISPENDTVTAYKFYYTNGILSKMDHYNETYPVIYNQSENSYTFEYGFKIGVGGRDLSYVRETLYSLHELSYLSTYKGAFYNVDSNYAYLLPLFSETGYAYLTTSPIDEIKSTNDDVTEIFKAQHTYDEEGYVTSTVLRSESRQFLRAQYHYINL